VACDSSAVLFWSYTDDVVVEQDRTQDSAAPPIDMLPKRFARQGLGLHPEIFWRADTIPQVTMVQSVEELPDIDLKDRLGRHPQRLAVHKSQPLDTLTIRAESRLTNPENSARR